MIGRFRQDPVLVCFRARGDDFWLRVDKEHGPTQAHMETACWPWLGRLSDGYGRFVAGGVVEKAHRVSFFLTHKYFPAFVLHECDMRSCVRPDHLYQGTKEDNARDREKRERGNHATGERHGTATHPGLRAGERNGRAKLTAEDARNLRELAAKGHPIPHMAEELGISRVAAYDIIHGKLWPDAGGPIVQGRIPRYDHRS